MNTPPRVHEGRVWLPMKGTFLFYDTVPGIELEDYENLFVRIPHITQAIQGNVNIPGPTRA